MPLKGGIIDTTGANIMTYNTRAPSMHREAITAAYLDFLNSWLTVKAWAEHHGLTEQEGANMIAAMRIIANNPHPES